MTTNIRTHAVTNQIPHNPLADLFFEGDDGISNDELAHSCTVMYESWVTTIKINEDLQGQVHQLSQAKEALEEKVATLKGEILKNSMTQFEL